MRRGARRAAALGRRRPRRRNAATLAVVDGGDVSTALFYLLFFGVPWSGGRLMRLAHQRQSLLEDRALLLEAQRDEQARAAVEEERRRIARELHDVVSHAISVVVLQARGGRRMLEAEPDQSRAAFDAIERTSTTALGEMRRLLGLLRAEGDDPLLPQPTLGRVDELADQLRASGLPVEVSVQGTAAQVPPGIDVSAYRIVQEALTNALRHAGPARARVRIVYEEDALLLEVADDGAATGVRGNGDAPPSGGHGLVGIRERVALAGGVVRAGPAPTGGYAVSARLPYAAQRCIRVLLADDQALVRTGFRMILAAEPGVEVVGEAADGAEAVVLARERRPDVVLMDIRLPEVDGIEATRRMLRRGDVRPAVLVLTTFDLDAYVYEALRAGASGFLLKDAPEDHLIAGIRVVADGGSLFAPAVTRRLIERFAAAEVSSRSASSGSRATKRRSGSKPALSRVKRSTTSTTRSAPDPVAALRVSRTPAAANDQITSPSSRSLLPTQL